MQDVYGENIKRSTAQLWYNDFTRDLEEVENRAKNSQPRTSIDVVNIFRVRELVRSN